MQDSGQAALPGSLPRTDLKKLKKLEPGLGVEVQSASGQECFCGSGSLWLTQVTWGLILSFTQMQNQGCWLLGHPTPITSLEEHGLE